MAGCRVLDAGDRTPILPADQPHLSHNLRQAAGLSLWLPLLAESLGYRSALRDFYLSLVADFFVGNTCFLPVGWIDKALRVHNFHDSLHGHRGMASRPDDCVDSSRDCFDHSVSSDQESGALIS